MKKRITLLMLSILIAFVFSGCDSENGYDDGVADTSSHERVVINVPETTIEEVSSAANISSKVEMVESQEIYSQEEIKETVSTEEVEEMVWIPRTGKKYHNNKQCSNMREPDLVTESEAIERGFTPCKNCY